MSAILDEIRRTELFRDVPTAIIEGVLRETTPQELAAGQVLLSPERENHHLYLLLSGLLTVHFGTSDSAPIREIQPGLSVGEMSIISPDSPSAYVIAKNVSTVLPIHRNLIESVMADAGPMARNLLLLLTAWMKSNTQRIVTDRGQLEELTDHANVDSLTRLYNRRWLDNALARLLHQSVGAERPLCILLIDVDHFKKYNDSQGHLGGDQALIAVGQVLKETVRPIDFAARYGGEEFLVLLPNTALGEAIGVAERIRLAVEKRSIAYPDGSPLPGVTISAGLARSRVDSLPQSLIAAADSLLYQAKSAGRNCVRFEAGV